MGQKTGIEWTDATWNPVTGCTKVSAGCKNCYAERDFHRPYPGRDFTDVRTHPDRLDWPLRWRGSKQAKAEGRPSRIFVNSMSDLFHEKVRDEFIGQVFISMVQSKHIFQILTKRPARMLELIGFPDSTTRAFESILLSFNPNWPHWPLPNVWLGVSVEDQKTADERIPLLLQTPAAVCFVSYEPALGPVDFDGEAANDLHPLGCGDLSHKDLPACHGLDWVIAGGESGPNARPSHPDWFRSVRDQCQAAGVPFFFKQWGEWVPSDGDDAPGELACIEMSGVVSNLFDSPEKTQVERVGKKRAGRVLDGREWSEFPKVTRASRP